VSGNWQIQPSFGRLGNKALVKVCLADTQSLWQTWRERFPTFSRRCIRRSDSLCYSMSLIDRSRANFQVVKDRMFHRFAHVTRQLRYVKPEKSSPQD